MTDRDDRTHIIGGPVCTRTADRSLHVNLLPSEEGRLCPLDCIYCPFPRGHSFKGWRTPGDIGTAVMNALHGAGDLDSITISGPGDPTLHPQFGRALADVLSARRVRPELPVRIVTSGRRACDPHVRRLLGFVDERLVRFDAGGDRIARPREPVEPEQIADALRELSDFCVESVFVDGPEGNTNERDVGEWIERLAELRPAHVTVTTIAQEPVEPGVCRTDAATLERIAAELRRRTGLATAVVP